MSNPWPKVGETYRTKPHLPFQGSYTVTNMTGDDSKIHYEWKSDIIGECPGVMGLDAFGRMVFHTEVTDAH